jgi:hypothetical protein
MSAPRRPALAAQLGLAALLLGAAVVFGVVRSRRTGIELGLLAVSQALFAAAAWPRWRTPARAAAWACLVAVAAIAVEPHLH